MPDSRSPDDAPTASFTGTPGAPPNSSPPLTNIWDAVTRTPYAASVPPGAELPDVPGYTVSREVARGGMGVVYAARDPVFEREVAVKVMHPGHDADQFVIEAKVTARLPHPGVPPVYALGTLADGRPFLAMKLIEGRTLARIAPSAGNQPHVQSAELLSVFERICETVGFAHARGIVHRDLKPSNVMVGLFGEVQVMDWGLAKELRTSDGGWRIDEEKTAVDPMSSNPQSHETVAGEVKGTPAFMAPEQARGEAIDARTDVFALGGILCSLLTGKSPFTGATTRDTIQKAARAELGECFAALDACGADAELIAVARRCLAAHPGDRYATGAEVAAGVSAYRAGVEQRLRRAEAEKVRADEQKKRVQLTLAVVLLLFVCGAALFAWYSDRQAGERKLADERAERARVEAEGQTAAARLAGERDAEARSKRDQARQAIASNLALASDLRNQLKFKQAEAALAQAAELAGSAPERRPDVARAQTDLTFAAQLDDIRYRKWGWADEGGGRVRLNTLIAAPEYRRAFAGRGLDLTALAPADAARRITASAIRSALVAAVDDWALYEPDEAIRSRLLEVARTADPHPWTDRLRDPVARSHRATLAQLAADADPTTATPATLGVLAELMWRANLDPVPFLATARAKYPTDFELAFALGRWYASRGDGQQIGPYEAARALRPDNPTVWKNLGVALGQRGDLNGAIAAHREAVRLAPTDATAHNNLAIVLRQLGDADGAIAACREAIRLDPEFAPTYDTLGISLQRKRDLDGAIEALREAIRRDPQYARAHNNLGTALNEKGDRDGALAALREAVRLDPYYATAYSNLGSVLQAKGDLDGALVALREAVRFNPSSLPAYSNLGSVLQEKGLLDEAASAYREAVRLNPKYADAQFKLGEVYFQQKKYPDAVTCARAAAALDARDASAHALLGQALRRTGDVPGARAALAEATRLDKRFAPLLAELPPLAVAPPPREVKRP